MSGAGARRALRLEDLTLGYERHPAIHHVSLTIPPGSLVGVVGPNGSGKSTLLKGLAGQLRPMQGQVHGLAGQRVAYLPQHADIDRGFPIRLRDLVAMGLWHEVGALGGLGPAHRERCRQALHAVGLEGFGHRTIDTLSGGQFQRALFARLLLQDADLVLLDEPFAAIDTRTTDDLLALLAAWHRAGRTVLVVLHDLQQVLAHCPHALVLARELVAWGPSADALSPANLQRARRMTEAWDDDADACELRGRDAGLPPEARAGAGPAA